MTKKTQKKSNPNLSAEADVSKKEISQSVSEESKTDFEPLYFGDTTDDGAVNVYTKQEYIEKFGEEPDEGQRLDDDQVKSWQNKEEISQEEFSSENVVPILEEEMTFTDKNVRSVLLDYCEPYVKTAYYKELFGEEKNEFTDEEIRKLSKSINLGDLLNTLDKKTLRNFAKDTGIPVSGDDERQKKLIVEGIKRLQQKEKSEQSLQTENNIDNIVDSGIEDIQVNNSKSEYLDPQGNDTRFEEWSDLEVDSSYSLNTDKQIQSDNDVPLSDNPDMENTSTSKPSYEELERIANEYKKQAEVYKTMYEQQTEQFTVLNKKVEALEQKTFANKEQSANDSLGNNQNYNSPQTQENQYQSLVNEDGFGRETAFKKNQKIPDFGYTDENGNNIILKNAVFSKLIVDENNIANKTVEVLVPQKDGFHKTFLLSEQAYNKIINSVQKLEERKLGQSNNSFEWLKAHLDYAQEMGIDKNTFRLNTVENFFHNMEVHCLNGAALNHEQVLKVAAVMFKEMTPGDQKRFNNYRKMYDKNNGEGAFDRKLLDIFDNINPELIQNKEYENSVFDPDKVFSNQDLTLKLWKNGEQIGNTNSKVGDTITMALKYKNPIDGSVVKEPEQNWKIVKVQENVYHSKALLYNEETKSYIKIPLKNLEEQIKKLEKLQGLEVKQKIKKTHKLKQYEGQTLS